jgi:hypothetical protein
MNYYKTVGILYVLLDVYVLLYVFTICITIGICILYLLDIIR